MGFWSNMTKEFGKKTGKAIGNKLYGAYADDKRVGINRGKLKEESDGLKVELKLQQAEAQSARFRADLEREAIEYEKNQRLLDEVLNIEFEPTNKDVIIKHLTSLSAYIDLWANDRDFEDYYEAASSKFEVGVAILNAIDPSNPMNAFFYQRKIERRKKKKKGIIGDIVLWSVVAIVTLTLLILIANGVIG